MTTYGESINECIDRLLGEPGTDVNVRVRHLDGTEQNLVIRRAQIVTRTVKGARRVGETWNYWLDEKQRIGYLRVTQFIDLTVDELREAVAGMLRGGINALVLDLRANPGGELGVAIDIADLFLDDGTIVSVRGRNRRAQSWEARREGTLPDFPMVVLVNRHSASASEIIAGALQDNGRAKVLGTRTFGKGSVQEVHELPYGQGSLKLTAAHYYLPNGRNISRTDGSEQWGVDPDPGLVVSMSDEGYRDVLLARREYTVLRPDGPGDPASFDDPQWIGTTLKDTQLAAALRALRAKLAGQPWPELTDEDAAQVAVEQRIDAQTRLRRAVMEQLNAVESNLQELYGMADTVGVTPLLPTDADVVDGRLTVTDRDGRVVATFVIGEGDLERALRDAPVEPVNKDQ
jgi:carboxyl-terminal processing protease